MSTKVPEILLPQEELAIEERREFLAKSCARLPVLLGDPAAPPQLIINELELLTRHAFVLLNARLREAMQAVVDDRLAEIRSRDRIGEDANRGLAKIEEAIERGPDPATVAQALADAKAGRGSTIDELLTEIEAKPDVPMPVVHDSLQPGEQSYGGVNFTRVVKLLEEGRLPAAHYWMGLDLETQGFPAGVVDMDSIRLIQHPDQIKLVVFKRAHNPQGVSL